MTARLRTTPARGVVAMAVTILAGTLVMIAGSDAVAAANCPSYSDGQSRGAVTASGLEEASGLAAGRANADIVWAHADSGTAARLFALDATDASLVAAFDIAGATNVDWEDIAVGPGPTPDQSYLYIGDIGGNAAAQANIVYRVPEPVIDPTAGAGPHVLAGAVALPFSYPDGPHDAETLLADPTNGDLFVVTKAALVLPVDPASVFRYPAPHSGAATQLAKVADLDFSTAPLSGWLATGGDISPDGDKILIRTYLSAFVWRRAPTTSIADALSGDPCPVPVLSEPQGEAVGFASDGLRYFTLSERTDQSPGAQPLNEHECRHGFTDVARWVDPAVTWITCRDHATGYDDDTFRPDRPITRAAATRMLYRIAGSPDVTDPGYDHPFTDVPDWVDDAVRWITHDPDGSGPGDPIASGYPGNLYRPDNNITRAEATRVLYRLAGSPDVTDAGYDHPFTDVPTWVDDAVRWITHDPDGSGPLEPIATGYPGNLYRPDNNITRAQVANMLHGIYG